MPMKAGAVKKYKLPYSFDGIRFTLGRMLKMIQDGRKDPLVISIARKIAVLSTAGRSLKGAERDLYQLRGIHAWCRANFEYVRDPVNVELIQTPNRMLRELKIPPQLHKAIWGPIGKALGGKMPAPKMSGDADETTTLSLSLAAAVGITPLRIRLGGFDGIICTCWGAAQIGGVWEDIDILHAKFGSHAAVELIEHVDVHL